MTMDDRMNPFLALLIVAAPVIALALLTVMVSP